MPLYVSTVIITCELGVRSILISYLTGIVKEEMEDVLVSGNPLEFTDTKAYL